MADLRYDIGQIFQAAFGINTPVYMTYPIRIGKAPELSAYSGITLIPEEEGEAKSVLGTPIIFPISLKGGTYQVYDGKGKLREKTYKDYTMPGTTLVDFSRAKNITRTNVLGSNGTVKEIFGFDDWKIRMRGVCLPDKDLTVKEQKEHLLAWEEVAGSIEVSGALFTEKNISALVIESIDLKQLQGKPMVIPFEISASSDQAIELILQNRQS